MPPSEGRASPQGGLMDMLRAGPPQHSPQQPQRFGVQPAAQPHQPQPQHSSLQRSAAVHASLVCRRRAELESDLSLALGAAFERAEVERAVHTHGGDMAVVLDELLKGSHAAGAVQGAPAAMAVDEAMQEAQELAECSGFGEAAVAAALVASGGDVPEAAAALFKAREEVDAAAREGRHAPLKALLTPVDRRDGSRPQPWSPALLGDGGGLPGSLRAPPEME